VKAKRIPEAAFFAKTYCPSKIDSLVELWKNDLQKSHPVACKSLVYGEEFSNVFP